MNVSAVWDYCCCEMTPLSIIDCAMSLNADQEEGITEHVD
jgi:hypothetical protein